MRYLRPAHYDDLLTVRTQLRSLPEKHEIVFHQEIFNERKKMITSGKVTLYFLDKTSKKRTVLPEILREKLSSYFS
jgi:acyl-CoA thioester hydrolase